MSFLTAAHSSIDIPMRPPKITTLIAILTLIFHPSQLFVFASTLTEASCLARGFDPSNLSCETCHLLEESPSLSTLLEEYNARHSQDPIDIIQECRSCCQTHKFNPVLHHGQSLRGKYRYALLTYNEGSLDQFGEIKDFLDKDMNDVLSFKGEHRFRVSASEKGNLDSNMMQMMIMMGGGIRGFGGPPKLMLFETAKKGGGKWSEGDEDEAGEVITLRGWKREDVKDMLMTLLPNA